MLHTLQCCDDAVPQICAVRVVAAIISCKHLFSVILWSAPERKSVMPTSSFT